MGKKSKQKRLERQIELLKHFDEDHYQEKKVGDNWYVKMWNGNSKKWQVAVFSETSFKKYKAFAQARKEKEEMDTQFKESLL